MLGKLKNFCNCFSFFGGSSILKGKTLFSVGGIPVFSNICNFNVLYCLLLVLEELSLFILTSRQYIQLQVLNNKSIEQVCGVDLSFVNTA